MAAIEKKILLAVDGSAHSRAMLDYIVLMRPNFPGLTYCLFYVQRGLSPMLVEEAESDPQSRARLDAISRRNVDHARSVLDDSRQIFVRGGVAAESIETFTQQRILGLARDIIVRAEMARYDAIAVGRRGLTGVQQLFMGSLTAKLCEHSQIIPIWVVDGYNQNDGFLLAVDGSESALRAVDHLAFMLTGSPSARVTLLHVVPRFADHCEIDFKDDPDPLAEVLNRSDRQCLDRFAAAAKARFAQAGFDPGGIEFMQIQRTTGIGRNILDIARRQHLGSVVIGRRGSGGAFYHGRVCRYVMEKSTRRTFWLVP